MPQFRKLILLVLVVVTGLSACGTLEVSLEAPPTPSVDAAQVATIVAGTLAAWPSTPPRGTQTYSDPELGFRLQYEATWQLDAKAGSGMAYNGGRGRTISIGKENYIFQLNVIAGPGDVNGCAGMFQENPSSEYQVYHVDGVELWRIKAEAGYINGFSNDVSSYLNVISPLVLYKQADSAGF